MGTIAEKLTYLSGTKDKLKESINNIGGSITSETTFRNYASQLDTIYSNLPKTTGTGSSLSLTPTLKGKLNYTEGKVLLGNTTQDGTPTPDNPQTIYSVTGEQEVAITGTNILPITLAKIKELNSSGWTWSDNVGSRNSLTFTINDDLSIKINGTASANTYLDLTGEVTFGAGTYTFSGTPSTRK